MISPNKILMKYKMLEICPKIISNLITRLQNYYTNILTKNFNNNKTRKWCNNLNLLFIFIVICLFTKTLAQYNPCSGKFFFKFINFFKKL